MTREDLVSEIRKIEIASRNSSRFSLSGNFRSALKGSGMEIAGFKEYSTDDDYRAVDWNVSARTGRIYSRIYQEERENPVFFIVDTSSSMYTGGLYSGERKTKIETSAVVMALIAFSAVFNNDRAGSVFCSDTVEDEYKIGGKSAHIADMVFSLLDHNPSEDFFDLSYALSCIPQSIKRGCCFVISDFKTTLPSGQINAAGRNTDLVFIRITDPSDTFSEGLFSFYASDVSGEFGLTVKKTSNENKNNKPGSLSAVFRRKNNTFTDRSRYINLGRKNSNSLKDRAEKYLEEQRKLIIREGVSFLDISTEDNIPSAVNSFFQNRKK